MAGLSPISELDAGALGPEAAFRMMNHAPHVTGVALPGALGLRGDEPTNADLQVVDAGVAAAKQLGLRWQKMVSRAYHDSLFMAKACTRCLPASAWSWAVLILLEFDRGRRTLPLKCPCHAPRPAQQRFTTAASSCLDVFPARADGPL